MKKGKPKYTKEEYEELTGQGLGALTGQGSSSVTNTDTTRTVTGVRG